MDDEPHQIHIGLGRYGTARSEPWQTGFLQLRSTFKFVRRAALAHRLRQTATETKALRALGNSPAVSEFGPQDANETVRGQWLAVRIQAAARAEAARLQLPITREDESGLAVIAWCLYLTRGDTPLALTRTYRDFVDQGLRGDVEQQLERLMWAKTNRVPERSRPGLARLIAAMVARLGEQTSGGMEVDALVTTALEYQLGYLGIDTAATQLLKLLAFYSGEPFVLDVLEAGFTELPEPLRPVVLDPVLLGEVIDELVSHGLLEALDHHRTRLAAPIAAAVRELMSDRERREFAGRAIRVLDQGLNSQSNDPRHWAAWRPALPHILAAVDVGDEHDLELTRVGSLLYRLSAFHRQGGNPDLALPLAERAVRVLRRRDRGGPMPLAWALSNQAMALARLDRFDKAFASFEEAMEIERETLGPGAELASSLNVYGGALGSGRRDRDAERVRREALAMIQEHPDPESTTLGEILNDLGHTLMDLGSYGDALGLFERAMEVLYPGYGFDFAMYGYGVALSSLEQYQRARSVLENCVEWRRALYGDGFFVAHTMHDLSKVIAELGEKTTARQIELDANRMIEASDAESLKLAWEGQASDN
jgi:tetratricopeptide (TPR) repeat protein